MDLDDFAYIRDPLAVDNDGLGERSDVMREPDEVGPLTLPRGEEELAEILSALADVEV